MNVLPARDREVSAMKHFRLLENGEILVSCTMYNGESYDFPDTIPGLVSVGFSGFENLPKYAFLKEFDANDFDEDDIEGIHELLGLVPMDDNNDEYLILLGTPEVLREYARLWGDTLLEHSSDWDKEWSAQRKFPSGDDDYYDYFPNHHVGFEQLCWACNAEELYNSVTAELHRRFFDNSRAQADPENPKDSGPYEDAFGNPENRDEPDTFHIFATRDFSRTLG